MRYFSGISLEGLRKTTKQFQNSRCPSRDQWSVRIIYCNMVSRLFSKKTVMWQCVGKRGKNFESGTSASPGDQEWIQPWPFQRRFLLPRIQKGRWLIIHSTGFHTQPVRSATGCKGVNPNGFQYQDDFCFTPGGWDWVLWPYTVVLGQ
jgi:hypothetical protein